MNKEVCLIIPCYNSLDTIVRLLRSIKIQTATNFDTYLAIDGDNNLEDYQGLKDHFDIHILYFKENQGAGCTRQRALDRIKSKYKYVTFADSDDMLNPRCIESLYTAITKTNSDIAYSSIIRQLEDGSSYVIDVTNPEHKAISWCVGKMYKIDFLKKKKIRFRQDLRLNEDIYFNFVAFNSTNKIVQVKEVTYLWMYNANSTTTKDKSQDFYIYDIRQSILASTYSILDLAKKNKNKLDESLLAKKLINIYTISQEALYFNIPLSTFDNEYDLLRQELNILQFVKDNVKYFEAGIPQIGIAINNDIYLYEQSFIQFIKEAYNINKEGDD